MNLSMKQKQNQGHREQARGCQGTGGGKGKYWEFGISRCKLVYIEWINKKALLQSTGNYIQSPVINHNGEEYEKYIDGCVIYMCNLDTLLYNNNKHNLANQLYFNKIEIKFVTSTSVFINLEKPTSL